MEKTHPKIGAVVVCQVKPIHEIKIIDFKLQFGFTRSIYFKIPKQTDKKHQISGTTSQLFRIYLRGEEVPIKLVYSVNRSITAVGGMESPHS